MGSDLMRRPPKFVNGYIDRHGKPRFYFRRAGFKKMPLPGLPWSPEFMAAYEEALAGQPTPIGAARVRPGTIRALAVSYYNCLAFRSMKANTAIGLSEHSRPFLRRTGCAGTGVRGKDRSEHAT